MADGNWQYIQTNYENVELPLLHCQALEGKKHRFSEEDLTGIWREFEGNLEGTWRGFTRGFTRGFEEKSTMKPEGKKGQGGLQLAWNVC